MKTKSPYEAPFTSPPPVTSQPTSQGRGTGISRTATSSAFLESVEDARRAVGNMRVLFDLLRRVYEGHFVRGDFEELNADVVRASDESVRHLANVVVSLELSLADTTNGSAPAEGADAEGERGSGPAVGARSAATLEATDLEHRHSDVLARALAERTSKVRELSRKLRETTAALTLAQENAAQMDAAVKFAREELESAELAREQAEQARDVSRRAFDFQGRTNEEQARRLTIAKAALAHALGFEGATAGAERDRHDAYTELCRPFRKDGPSAIATAVLALTEPGAVTSC